MFNKLKDSTLCPKCRQIINKNRRVCPFCGVRLVEETKRPEEDTFFSSENSKAAVGDPYWLKTQKRAVMPNDEVFTSSGRNVKNGGYTQQNSTPQEEQVYTGEFFHDPNDTAYFSSSRKKAFDDTVVKRAVMPKDIDIFSSEKRAELLTAERQNVENSAQEPHDPLNNPYSGKNDMNTPLEETEHSHEFEAHTLIEFTKHRYAKKYVDRLEFILGGMLAAVFLCVVFEQVFVAPYMTIAVWIVTVVYAVLAFIIAEVTVHLWNKILTIVLAYINIAYSLFMLIFITIFGVMRSVNNIDLLIMFIPIIAVAVLSLRLTKRMSSLHGSWESYSTRAEERAKIDKGGGGYEIYSSEEKKNETE